MNDATLCRQQWFNIIPDICKIKTETFLARRRPIEKGLQKIISIDDNIYLWDGFDRQTCSDDVCIATHFEDNNHVNKGYSEYLFRLFQSRNKKLFNTLKSLPPLSQSRTAMMIDANKWTLIK
jgi:hypothetical protein